MSKQGIVKRDNKETITAWMEQNHDALDKAFPATIDTDRLIRIVRGTITRTPDLQRCSWTSLLGAVLQSALIGLEPDSPLQQAHLIAYGGEVKLIIGYRGYCTLAIRSGHVLSISSACIYEKDEFDFEYGTNEHLRHRPTLDAERGEFIAAWAMITTKDRAQPFEVMPNWRIEKAKREAHGVEKPTSPWKKWFDDMACKTVMKHALKPVPMSADMATAQQIETDQDYRGKIDYSDAIEVVGVPVVDPEDSEGAPEADSDEAAQTRADAGLNPTDGPEPFGADSGGAP